VFKRLLKIDVPQKQSLFLWGARQTGKSFFLKQAYPRSVYYDLLDTHEVVRLSKEPHLLRGEIVALKAEQLKQPIVIDEIQKIPVLLNEVHWLIENTPAYFILCGSSARQLKAQASNLLGGRAWKYTFYPLVFAEIPAFDLLKALQHGLIPNHYVADRHYINDYLQAYIDVYLTDEIRNEGLVRNFSAFARFLDMVGLSNGEMVNATNIGRDCGVERTTVQSYYQILIDTLLGYFVYPYRKKVKRDIILSTPKFYLFDVGVANYLAQQTPAALKGSVAGRSFEHYIFMELSAFLGLHRKRQKITYWRTKQGLEVDFILGDAEIAIEIKISDNVHQGDLKGLCAFCEEHPTATAYVVSQDKRARKLTVNDQVEITILPWRDFLTALWAGDILT
jgi:uncharacterized protein